MAFGDSSHDHGGNVSAQIAYAQREDRPTKRWTYDGWYYNVTQHITVPGSAKTVELETLLFDSVIGLGNSDVWNVSHLGRTRAARPPPQRGFLCRSPNMLRWGSLIPSCINRRTTARSRS